MSIGFLRSEQVSGRVALRCVFSAMHQVRFGHKGTLLAQRDMVLPPGKLIPEPYFAGRKSLL
jgi:hypothetical protein